MKRDIVKDRSLCADYGSLIGIGLSPHIIVPILEHYIDRAEVAEKRIAELENAIREASHYAIRIDDLALWLSKE